MATSTPARPTVAVERFSASESGAWSNSYLLSDGREALLFDVFQMRSDATKLADAIDASGKRLAKVWISHAHPDHFLQLDLVVDRFPDVEVLTTPSVLGDLRPTVPGCSTCSKGASAARGPSGWSSRPRSRATAWPSASWASRSSSLAPARGKHHACLIIPDRQAIVASDLVYNGAHLYLQEHNLEGWLARLEELERLTGERGLSTIHRGHGPAGGLSLIQGTREYLQAFAATIQTGWRVPVRSIPVDGEAWWSAGGPESVGR
jgi:glyoxylase-like metal-dependent hydrolase (beta-lactamase superfamily II)